MTVYKVRKGRAVFVVGVLVLRYGLYGKPRFQPGLRQGPTGNGTFEAQYGCAVVKPRAGEKLTHRRESGGLRQSVRWFRLNAGIVPQEAPAVVVIVLQEHPGGFPFRLPLRQAVVELGREFVQLKRHDPAGLPVVPAAGCRIVQKYVASVRKQVVRPPAGQRLQPWNVKRILPEDPFPALQVEQHRPQRVIQRGHALVPGPVFSLDGDDSLNLPFHHGQPARGFGRVG